jgi:hypothetical protein
LPRTSYRRKPVSRNSKWLQKYWTPAFAGVTTFFKGIKVETDAEFERNGG